jgi:Asp-tRNA(Asn)/Glu-tRNA(Gln) amidotransferase B subunit
VKKVWTLREKAMKLISEAAKKVVSVLVEAFTILALTNNWERWTGNGTARWTDSKAGNYQYMGWADVAYVQLFDELCKRIREQRQTTLNKKLEQMYLARSSSLAGGGPHSRCLGGLVERNVEVYNKLDSEEED